MTHLNRPEFVPEKLPGTLWEEFSEESANHAAVEFARKCASFVSQHTEYNNSLFFSKAPRKFIDIFYVKYEEELQRIVQDNEKRFNQRELNAQNKNKRTLSKRMKNIFRRNMSVERDLPKEQQMHEDYDLPNEGENLPLGNPITRPLEKASPDIIREGMMHELANIEGRGDNGLTWKRCRLVLSKAPGGYMLEFYVPPKTSKPRTGVFCFLLHEARKASSLEMPDSECVFVIKAVNNKEYMLAANDADDMNKWLECICRCMEEDTSAPTTPNSPLDSPRTFAFDSQQMLIQFDEANRYPDNHAPSNNSRPKVISPLARQTSADRSASSLAAPSNIASTVRNSRTDFDDSQLIVQTPPERNESAPLYENHSVVHGADHDPTQNANEPLGNSNWMNSSAENHPLVVYPWFHGTITRVQSSMLVLHQGLSWNGVFLVRQSETRSGEYVLTFNLQGRSKHLRLSLNPDGNCQVQHLCFQTIFDMLEHFRSHPIPLENTGQSHEVCLTNFIVCDEPTLQSNATAARTEESNGANMRRANTYNLGSMNRIASNSRIETGSVRQTREALERMRPSAVRAVHNSYAMV